VFADAVDAVGAGEGLLQFKGQVVCAGVSFLKRPLAYP